MKKSAVPTEFNQQTQTLTSGEKLSLSYVGQVSGIPLPKETLALIAMKAIYAWRERIIEDVAFKFGPEFVGEAQELAAGLLVIEQLLAEAGVSTERRLLAKEIPGQRYTFLETVADALSANVSIPTDSGHESVLAQVNRQFRPWLKQTKAATAAR